MSGTVYRKYILHNIKMERNIAFESSVGSKFRMKSKQSKNDQNHALQNKNQFSKSPNFIRTKDRHRITYVLVS